MVHALPEPGPWLQGGILEADGETRRFTRGEPPGNREEQTSTITAQAERRQPHVFTITTGPLTTRFFSLLMLPPC